MNEQKEPGIDGRTDGEEAGMYDRTQRAMDRWIEIWIEGWMNGVNET